VFAGDVVSNESAVVENASFILRLQYLPYEVPHLLYIIEIYTASRGFVAIAPLLLVCVYCWSWTFQENVAIIARFSRKADITLVNDNNNNSSLARLRSSAHHDFIVKLKTRCFTAASRSIVAVIAMLSRIQARLKIDRRQTSHGAHTTGLS